MDLEDKNLTGGTPPENTPPAMEPPQTPSAEPVPTAPSTTPDMGASGHSAGGKRLATNPRKTKTAVVAAIVAALLLAVYLGACAYANTAKGTLPNTKAAGVDLSGLAWEQVEGKLEEGVRARLESISVDFVCEGTTYTVPGSAFVPRIDQALEDLKGKQSGNFLLGAPRLLTALLGGDSVEVPLSLATMPQEVLKAVEEWSDKDAVTDYTLTDTHVIFTKGRTGRTLDVAALLTGLEEQAMKAMAGEKTETVQVSVATMPPAEPNFEAIRRELYAEVAEAFFDPETGEIVPSVTGKDLDVVAARATLERTAEGAKCQVALNITEPEVSTETLTELLFRDVLGECTTYAYGNVARRTNVRLSAEFANGFLLMPGEEFSYATDCGPFVTERGFMAAPGYQGGKTIDMEGGGVCQTASTIYLAVLRSGLEVVERHPHGYEPAYVPAGLDATVAGTVLDFRFSNNTDYPVKIETSMDAKYNLTVKILGTNVTGTHWEPFTKNRVITQYAKTVYEPNEDIPQGTTEKDPSRTAYNGITVDSYNKEVDADGNVIQEIYLYRTKYKVRDAVIWYNPADTELWGINPETGELMEPTDPEGEPDPETSTEPQPGESEEPGTTESMPPAVTDPGDVPIIPVPPENTPAPETTPELPPEETPEATPEVTPPPAENTDQPVG